jgi:hypothetical protein
MDVTGTITKYESLTRLIRVEEFASKDYKLFVKQSVKYNKFRSLPVRMAATFLVFYRFKSMSKDEAKKANSEWHELKNSLPSEVELVGEYDHAWGTEYNGFLLFEADSSDSFFDWWSGFKDKVRWYVEQTHTIVARRR